jgi:hypothetical protein
MGTGSFPGVKRPGRGVDHPPQSSAEVKERVELYLYSTSGTSWPDLGRTLPLPFGRTDKNTYRIKEKMDSRNIKSKFHCTETTDSRR